MSAARPTCKGKNCTSVGGSAHSEECEAEHDACTSLATGGTVQRHELATWRMLDGNEYVYPIVIDRGRLLQWMSVGWVDVSEPTEADLAKYPTVIETTT